MTESAILAPLVNATAELARRDNDGLQMFRAMESQMPVFTEYSSECLVKGGNRSGKSVSAAARCAAIARDKPVYGPDGTPYEQRRPWQKDRPLLIWVVGLQWDHIGDTIWRLLFKRGLYKIIRDETTRRWRAYDPVKDKHRESEKRDSFPLIPMSEVKGGVKGIGWENLKLRQFSRIEMKNGTIIRAWASTGEVKQGDPVDYIWIDERIAIPGHYPEWQARLSDTKGSIMWSTLPREDNGAMLMLSHRAEMQAEEVQKGERKQADCKEITLIFSHNPHIEEDEKRKRLEGWSEEERRRRDCGEFLTDTIRIYPTYDHRMHCAIFDDPDQDDGISRILRSRNGVPPKDWTRDLILDPGTAKPGVLFCATPPPHLWEDGEPSYVPYDEIYIPRLDARQLARKIKEKSAGYQFQRFIIDGHAARQKPMGFSGTVGQEYSREFHRMGLVCKSSGSSFIPGDPTFETRKGLVESAMAWRPSGRPQLRIVVKRCPKLVWQLQNNVKQTERGTEGITVVLEKEAKGQLNDIRVCLEYWLSRRPTYIEPDAEQVGGIILKTFREFDAKYADVFDKQKKESDTVNCGPGEAA